MTIAAGFRFDEGLVLCADTQETIGVAKKSVPKLFLEPSPNIGKDSPDDLMIAVAGAGDGPFIDKLIELAWLEVSTATSIDDACSGFAKSIKATHREYGRIFQPGQMPFAEIICGIKMQGQSRMFVTKGPIVNPVSLYCSVGCGYFMSDFLARRMHHDLLTKRQCLILAAYILFQCKEHVDGCGGESHIAILSSSGKSYRVGPLKAERISHQLDSTDAILGSLLLHSADLELNERGFKAETARLLKRILHMRDEARSSRPDYNALFARLNEEDAEEDFKKQMFRSLKAEPELWGQKPRPKKKRRKQS